MQITTPVPELFVNPDQPAVTADGNFAADARRVLELTTLQLSLERYRLAKGAYPRSLDDLFPDFAPVENGSTLTKQPVDPKTGQPYAYAALDQGQSYRLTATLEGGSAYTVGRPNLTR